MLPFRTILHATDFSEHSGFAFWLACALARDYGARVVVVHVVTPTPVAGYAEGVFIPDPQPSHDKLRELLQSVRPTDPKIPVEHRMVEGDAADEIVRTAQETKCDLIVIGTHGRSGFGRLLMGSVAEDVLRGAPCPVVTVRQALPETASASQATAKDAVVASR